MTIKISLILPKLLKTKANKTNIYSGTEFWSPIIDFSLRENVGFYLRIVTVASINILSTCL